PIAVPEREGHAVETLARDAPIPCQVFDPVLVAGAHVLWPPGDLPAGRQQRLLRIQNANEPLLSLQDLQRRLAALVDTDGLLGRALAQQQASLAHICDNVRTSFGE